MQFVGLLSFSLSLPLPLPRHSRTLSEPSLLYLKIVFLIGYCIHFTVYLLEITMAEDDIGLRSLSIDNSINTLQDEFATLPGFTLRQTLPIASAATQNKVDRLKMKTKEEDEIYLKNHPEVS